MKCEVCGAEQPPGKKFCTLCGSPLKAGAPAQPQSAAPQYAPPASLPAVPGVDPDLIADILSDSEKKKKRRLFRPWKMPEFWFVIGMLMLLPSLYFPWFHLYPGHSAGAFFLPLLFLLTGQQSWLPLLSTGAVIAALLVVCAVLLLKKDRIATYLKAAAYVAIALSMLAALSGFRAWNLHDKNPDAYPSHVKRQSETLGAANAKASNFIGQSGTETPPEFSREMFAGKSGYEFVKNYLGLGALFAFLGGAFIIGTARAYSRSLKFLHYDIAPTPMAAIIIVCTAAAVLLCVRYFIPDRWYLLEASAFQTVGLRNSEEAALTKCTELAIPSPSCEIQLAELYYDTQRNDKAFAMFTRIIGKYPRYVEADKYLGLLYFRGKYYDDTARHFRRYLEINTSDIEIKKKLAETVIFLGADRFNHRNYDDALKFYIEAYGLHPAMKTRTPLLINIGDCYDKKKDYANAARYFKTTADLLKDDFEAQIKAAEMLEKAGDYDGSVQYYGECAKIKPDYTECYVRAGDVCRKRLKDNDQAADWYRKAIKANDLNDWAKEAQKRLRELE